MKFFLQCDVFDDIEQYIDENGGGGVSWCAVFPGWFSGGLLRILETFAEGGERQVGASS